MQVNGQQLLPRLSPDDQISACQGWMMGDNRRRGDPPPLSAHTKHWHTTTTGRQHIGLHFTVTIQQRKMKWHQSFSSFHRASPSFYLKCVKTKNKFVVVFAHSNWRHLGWARAAGGQGHLVWAQQPKYLLELRPGAKIILVSPVCRVRMHSAGPGRVHINWDNFFKLLKIFMGMQVAVNNDLTIRICFQTDNNCL